MLLQEYYMGKYHAIALINSCTIWITLDVEASAKLWDTVCYAKVLGVSTESGNQSLDSQQVLITILA